MLLYAAEHRFQLRFKNLRQHGVQILIIIVKRLAVDFAPRHQIGHGDFVKRPFVEHLDKHVSDHVSGILLRHVLLRAHFFLLLYPFCPPKASKSPAGSGDSIQILPFDAKNFKKGIDAFSILRYNTQC